MDREDPPALDRARAATLIACVPWILFSWVLYETLTPFDLVAGWADFANRLREGLLDWRVRDLWGHIATLALVGITVGLDPRGRALRLVGFCVLLEILQATILERHPRGGDLLVNLSVALVAFLASRRLINRDAFQAWVIRHGTVLPRVGALGYVCLIGIGVTKAEAATSLTNWRPEFALHLGDEGTLNRPWSGEFQGVAIYGQALSPDTVHRLGETPFSREGLALRRGLGAVALYAVAPPVGDRILDESGVAPPLHLVVATGRPPHQPYFVSEFSGEKVTSAARAGSQFTVEIRGRSHSLEQAGPARVVSLSVNPYRRNFTVGQERRSLHFRVRSPAAGRNGLLGHGEWSDVFTDDGVHDLTVTYNKGRMVLFKDGLPVGTPAIQRRSWAGLGGNNPFVALILLFLPLGVLSRCGWQRTRWQLRITVSAFIGVCVVFLGMLAGVLWYDSAFRLALPAIALLGVPCGDGLVALLGIARSREG